RRVLRGEQSDEFMLNCTQLIQEFGRQQAGGCLVAEAAVPSLEPDTARLEVAKEGERVHSSPHSIGVSLETGSKPPGEVSTRTVAKAASVASAASDGLPNDDSAPALPTQPSLVLASGGALRR